MLMPKKMEDLTGHRFGMWTVLGFGERRDRSYFWKCRCDCGNERIVGSSSLKSGTSKGCGCTQLKHPKNLVGERNGKLLVLEQGNGSWFSKNIKCICDCGNILYLSRNSFLKNSSCGCMVAESAKLNKVDMTGQRFGRLLVIEDIEKRTNSRCVHWKCLCDCGKYTTASRGGLLAGNIKSCGCLGKENMDTYIHFDGTNVSRIRSKAIQINNTSGVRGVYYAKGKRTIGKWGARIGFKGESYHLGFYEKISDATLIRKQAEEKIFGEFLEWYDSQFPKKIKKGEVNNEILLRSRHQG